MWSVVLGLTPHRLIGDCGRVRENWKLIGTLNMDTAFLFFGPCIFNNEDKNNPKNAQCFYVYVFASRTRIHKNILTDQYNGFVTLKDFELPDDGFD